MRCLTAIPLLLACLTGVGAAHAQENSIEADQFGVKVDELREFLGLDLYKYVVRKQAVGDKFDVVLRQFDVADAKPREFFRKSYTVLRTDRPSDVPFTICFLKKDQTIGSALLSNDEEIILRIQSAHCRPGGMTTTTITLPLANVKQKILDHRVDAKTERPDHADGAPLLALRKSTDQPGTLTYPYAELAIVPGN